MGTTRSVTHHRINRAMSRCQRPLHSHTLTVGSTLTVGWLIFLGTVVRFGRLPWAHKHSSEVGPPEDGRHQSPEHHVPRMDFERKQLIRYVGIEALASDDCPQVATGPNQSGHHGELLSVHERHNSIARAFRHLNTGREANQHEQRYVPRVGVVDEAKPEEEYRLEEECQKLGPDPPRECKSFEESVAQHPSEGSR